jgi:FkbM family methyltransferase
VFVIAGAIIAAAAAAAGGFAWRDSKAASFLRLVWSRDEHCSVGQAWECVGDRGDTWDRRDEVAEQFRLLESQSGFELVEAPQGRFWIPVRNREVLAEMLVDEEQEVYGAGGRGVHPGDTVLDCGANIGVFTRHALERGARLVVAIEPAPENLYCLRRNLAEQIQAGRVIVYPKGVWDRDDELVLRTFDAQSGGDSVALQFPGSREGPKVQLTTIDKLTAELHLERVDFIKMDIEGAEPQALTGALRTVARFRPRMAVSMEHRPDDIRAIPALVRRLWPELRSACGPCVWVGTALVDRVQPDVLFVGP